MIEEGCNDQQRATLVHTTVTPSANESNQLLPSIVSLNTTEGR